MADQPTLEQPVSLPRWKRLLFGSIILLVVIAVSELLAILYLRATQGYDGEHLYQYVYDPYKNILPTPGYVDTRGVRHNSVGFRRSSEVSLAKPAGVYRIFIMGASTAYGLGGLWPHIDASHPVLTNEETIDAYLERQLTAELSRRVEVINAAITSTWTHHNLIYLNQTILNYQPDLILFMDGYNDFFFFGRNFDQFATYSYNSPGRVILGEPSFYALGYGVGWWLFRKWALPHVVMRGARTAKLLVTPRHKQRPISPDSAMLGLRTNFPRNALLMQRRIGLVARDAGVATVFMLQPMLILERNRVGADSLERRLFTFNVASHRPGYESYIHRAVVFVREEQTKMTRDVGAHYLDLTNAFDGVSGQMYTDYAHLTPSGNEVIAKRITDYIKPLIVRASEEPPAAQRQP